MALPRLATSPGYYSLVGAHSFRLGQTAWHCRPSTLRSPPQQKRSLTTTPSHHEEHQNSASPRSEITDSPSPPPEHSATTSTPDTALPPGWEDNPAYHNIKTFSQLPHRHFGHNQHMRINDDFKEALRQILWQFKAPIRYAFAYGSGVFSQGKASADALSPHPNPGKAVQDWQNGGAKIIDFIFGVSHTQHWHSLNLTQHPEHYSALKHLPYSSAAISRVQDSFGAGVYFNPYITVNGTMIKYGVVNLATLSHDLSNWSTLYLAGRLHKPVKILRDDPRIRLANQVNLISALRTALLMLPEHFTERQLYERIASLSYLGDPRMNTLITSENPRKVSNIVGSQLPGFRQLYVPLINNLPNVSFTDPRTPSSAGWETADAIRQTGTALPETDILGGATGLELSQDLDPRKRGNMVRRLPAAFRRKLYYQYKSKFGLPGSAFDEVLEASEDEDPSGGLGFRKREGGEFERRIAGEADLAEVVGKCVRSTVQWPATVQSAKGVVTAGVGRSWRYWAEKRAKGGGKAAGAEEGKEK
ncbi:hypothetical protein LTR08_007608 [Meristemomyces frigidus]|nr:hypothetical protein LTR08_007608 [Meristemomyces frigidus]